MNKDHLKKIILICTIFAFLNSYAYAKEFVDIPNDFWAYNEIDYLTDVGLFNGYEDNTFRPKQYVTRAEYATLIMRTIGMDKIPIETMYTFEDVSNTHWAWKYIIRAVNLDILKPASDGNFYPNDYVTRREIITFLVNLLRTEGITKKDAIKALQNAYLDFDDIPDWFKPTAGKAEIIGVIAKEPPREKYLDYDAYITRAQMAVFINKLKEKVDEYEEEKIKEETSPKIGDGIVIENVAIDNKIATFPAGTFLPVMIVGQISSNDTAPGQPFKAKFSENIINNQKYILIPKDTNLIGKVLDTTKSKTFVRNGEMIIELSAVNKDGSIVKIMGIGEYHAKGKAVIKGREFIAHDGDVLNIRLYRPLNVNIITGEFLP